MAKKPVFYVLATLVLWSVSLVAPSAHAAESKGNCLPENKYFHLECSSTAGSSNRSCYLSQVETTTPDNDFDYACWLDVSDKLENSDNKSSQIILNSELDFGGYNDSKNECALTFFPIGSGHSFDGQDNIIKGFCYSAANAGFYETLSGKEFKNVTFKNPYVVGQYAGVIASTIQDAAKVSNVTIQNASLFGVQVGGVASEVKKVSNSNEISINNVTINGITLTQDRTYLALAATFYMGSVAGFVNNTNVSVSNTNVDGISVVSGSGSWSFGGLIGEFYNATGNISNSTITTNAGLNIEGSSDNIYVGGVVGDNYASNTTVSKVGFNGNLSGKYVGGIIGHLKDFPDTKKNVIIKNTYTKGNIQGTKFAGFIIGYSEAATNLDQSDSLYNNFHFGSDAVSEGVGNYAGENTWGYSWAQGTLGKEYVADQGNIFANVRNASSRLTANETFGFHFNVLNDTYNNVLKSYMDFFEGSYNPSSSAMWPMIRVANGIAKDADMESGLFAALLNYNLEVKGQDAIWISDGGLPTFAGETEEPNHLVLLETSNLGLGSDQINDLTNKIASIRDSSVSNNGGNLPDPPVSVKSGIVSYTGASGSLNSDFGGDVAKLVSFGTTNLGGEVTLMDASGNSVSQTGTFDSYQMLHFAVPSLFFCFKENGSELEFHQVATTTPDDETCFDFWYHDDGSGNDAYTYAQTWLDNTDNGSIVLTGNVVFAGTTSENNVNAGCVDEPNAFKGKYLELGSGDIFKSEDGTRHTVFGLCYVSSTARESVGFVKTNAATSRVENITFSDVFFKLTGVNSKAGVLLPTVSPSSINGISVSNSKFNADSVGAIAGAVKDVESVFDITLSGVKLDGKIVGSLFGCVSATKNVSISNIAVEGSSDGFINSSNYAGGLVGRMNADKNITLSIKNTYTIGDIICRNSTAGYLISDLENSGRFTFDITDNYHYGTNDASAGMGINGIGWDNSTTGAIARNFRNAITTGDATGKLQYAEKPVYLYDAYSDVTTEYYNGVISENEMKSARFAAVLNMGAANPSEMFWTVKSVAGVSVNNGLPVFVGIQENPSFPVRFDLGDFNARASEQQKQTLNDASSTYPVVDLGNNSKGFILFTDYNGNLASDDVSFVNSLLVYGDNTNDTWKNEQGSAVNLDVTTPYDDGFSIYTFASLHPMPFFCFKEDATNKILNFSQINKVAPETDDGTCFAYWYDAPADHSNGAIPDAYTHISTWLSNNQGTENSPATINLTSEIDFAGYDDQSGTCIDAPNALGGSNYGISLGAYQKINGNSHTISRLCYIGSVGESEFGFINVGGSGADVTDIAFLDVYFYVHDVSRLGVFSIAPGVGLNGKITIKDSKIISTKNGASAGAFAGRVENFAGISNVTVEDVEVEATNAGAIVGYVESYSSNAPVRISNIKVIGTNSIKSSHDDSDSYVGGIIGYAKSGSGAKQVKYENISVEASVKGYYAGGLFGYIQETPDNDASNANNPTASLTIQNASVLGDVLSYDAAFNSDQYAGGLVGYFDFSGEGSFELNIKNTYSKGSIRASGADIAELGYLIGVLVKDANHKIKFGITDNYHFMTNNGSVLLGIACFIEKSRNIQTDLDDEFWNNPEEYQNQYPNSDLSKNAIAGSVIARNFRNTAASVIPATGDLRYAPAPIKNGNESYYNGTLDEEQMKTARFAAVLNMDGGEWTLKNDVSGTLNDGLPVFADNSVSPIYAVRFNLGSFYSRSQDAQKDILQDAIANGERELEYIDATHDGIVLFTDNAGKLASTDVDFVNSLLDENASWRKQSETPDLSATAVYNGNSLYTYKSSLTTQYFCFIKYDNSTDEYLYFKQVELDEPSTSDGTCFTDWFNGSGNDAYTFIQNWLDENNSSTVEKHVYVSSNIEFAGTELDINGNTVCADGPNAFKGKFLELGDGDSFTTQPSEQQRTNNVSGLCYMSDDADDEIGFVKVNSEKGYFGSVNFSNVHFKLTGSGNTKAGVVLYGTDVSVSGLDSKSVSNSLFEARYAGAITGYVKIKANPDLLASIGYHAHVQKLTVSNDTVNGYYAGAAIGYATADYVDVSDMYSYSTTVNSTNYGGGLFGYVSNITELTFKNNSISGSDGKSSVDGKYAGGLAGYLGVERGGSVTIQKSIVYRDVSALCDGSALNCSAGSLVGNFDVLTSGSGTVSLNINHNYSVGNIKKTGTGDETSYIGYLVGFLVKGKSGIEYYVSDNYHYGKDDALAKVGIGSFASDVNSWMNPGMNSTRSGFIARNFRNAIDGSLDADGDLYYDEMPVHHYDAATNTTMTYYNGIIPVEQMQTRRLAAVLNMDEANWTMSPGYMPTFADRFTKAIYPVFFDLDAFYAKADDDHKKILKDSVEAGLRQFETIGANSKGIVLYTNNTGTLESADADFVLSLVATGDSWKNGDNGFSSALTYASGNTIYTYSTPTVSIEKQFCVTENGNYLDIGQYENTNLPENASCYKYWFNGNGSDAYTHITEWLKNNSSGTVRVQTDIRFAGRTFNEAKGEYVCNDGDYSDGNDAFKGKMITLGENQSIIGTAQLTGYTVISGLCHVASARERDAGFIRALDGSLQQLAFDNAYFKSEEDNSAVGIIVSGSGVIKEKNLNALIQNNINLGRGPSIKVTNSEFHGDVAGAIFGRGGKSLPHAVVENVKVYGETYAGGLVGESGYALDIEFAEVHADVHVSKSRAYAGGLVGYLNNSATDNNLTVSIIDNYFIGDVTGTSNSTLGYLMGGVNSVSNLNLTVKSNYHYGTNDAAAERGIGSLTASQWNTNAKITHNFRNAVGSLVAGTLHYASEPVLLSSTHTFYRNGIVSDEQMKSRFMAAVLNMNGYVWTERDNSNDGLPRFAAGTAKAIFPVFFDVESYETLADDDHKNILHDSVGAGYRQYETLYDLNGSRDYVVLYTDANGNLSSDDVEFVNSLLGEENYWYSSENSKREFVNSSTVYSDGNERYLYREGVKIYVVNHFCLNDGNGRCEAGSEQLVDDLLAGSQSELLYAYALAPVDKFVSNVTTALIPPLMVSDIFGDGRTILPSFYEINAKDPNEPFKTGNIDITRIEDMPSDITELDYTNAYNDTIHLYYVSGYNYDENRITITNTGDNTSLALNGFNYGADGTLSQPMLSDTISPNQVNETWISMPLALTVEPVDFGYTFNSWSLKFGQSGLHRPSVVRTANKYLTSPDAFVRNYGSKVWQISGLSVNDTVYMDSIYVGMQNLVGLVNWEDFFIDVIPSATANNFNVTFDLDSKVHKDSLIIFGNSWDFGNSSDFTREMSLDADKRNFPKAYIYSASTGKFYPFAWSHKTQDQFDFGDEFGQVQINNVAFTNLTSSLLENAANGDASVTDVTIYPINPVGQTKISFGRGEYQWIDDFDVSPINVVALDDDGNELTEAGAYHGSIVLSQTRGNVTLKQESRLVQGVAAATSSHRLYVPASASDDTLTFNVSTKVDPGYAMVLKGYEHSWDTAPTDEDWGLNIATDTVLKYSTANMGPSKFSVQFIQHHYNLEFVIPSDLLDKDIFVANKLVAAGKYETDWFNMQDDVTATTVKAPQLYDSYGCRIYWKPDGALHSALDIKEELQYLTPSTNGNFVNNELVPDYDNPDCALAQYHRIKVDIDSTKGHLYLVQKLAVPSQTPSLYDSIEITHMLDYTNGTPFINVPKVFDNDGNDNGTKLQVQIVAKEGYFFESVCADKYDGSFCEAFKNGSKLDIWDDNSDDGSWHVRFAELNPVYVTYDLSLTSAEDSAKVYLPAGAAPTGTLKMDTDKDSVVLWKPFRTDMCFAGWSEKSPDVHTTDDSLYKVLSVNNYHAFSKDAVYPTALHAIWDVCPSAPATSIKLKNGSDHASLVLYQLFGNDTLRHVIPSATAASGLRLVSSTYTDASGVDRTGYDFYLDEVNTKPEFGYTLENFALSYSYDPVDGSASVGPVTVNKNADGSWHVEQIAGETVAYTFNVDSSPFKFDLVFHVNRDSVVYIVKGENLDNLHKSIENVTVESNIELPTVDRVGACFNGWNIAPDPDSTNGYSHLEFLQLYVLKHIPLADVTVNTTDASGDPIQKIVYNLYPVWVALGTGNCTENTYTVSTDVPSSQGQFVIYQVVDGDSIKRSVNKESPVELPKNWTIHYRVKFEPAFGYTLAADARDTVHYGTGVDAVTRDIANDTIYHFNDSAGASVVSLAVGGLNANAYDFAFDANASGNVFYGDSWQNYMAQNASENNGVITLRIPYREALPQALYRAGNCLDGYTLDKDDDTDGLYNVVTQALIEKIASRNVTGAVTLYAKWSTGACANQTVYTVASNDADKGQLKLSRKFELNGTDSTTARVYSVPAAGLQVPSNGDVSFTGMSFEVATGEAFVWDETSPFSSKTGETSSTWNDVSGLFTVTGDVSVKTPLLTNTYTFVYDANAEGVNTFYVGNFAKEKEYVLDDLAQTLPLYSGDDLTRTDKCFAFWSFDKDATSGFTAFDADLLRIIQQRAERSLQVDTLYAIWDDNSCSLPGTFKVVSDMGDKGDFKLYQVNGSSADDTLWYDVGTATSDIPAVAGIKIGVKFIATSLAYSFGDEIVGVNADDESNVLFTLDNGTATAVHGELFTVAANQKDVKLSVVNSANMLHFAFNENSEGLASLPYFGDDWEGLINSVSYNVDANNGNWIVSKNYDVNMTSAQKKFPMALYSNDACLSGYAFSATGTTAYTELDDDVVAEYYRGSYSSANPMVLYAVWDTYCVVSGTNVNFAGTEKGQYRFTRKFSLGAASVDSTEERVYTFATANVTLPSDNGDISFTDWSFITNSGAGVIVDTDSAIAYRKDDTSDWTVAGQGSLFNVTDDVKFVNVPLLKNSYTFTYDKNWTEARDVFFSATKLDDATYTIDDVSESIALQPTTVMGRTDACLTGWALDPAGSMVIDAFDAAALRKLDSLEAEGEDIGTLYAVWADAGTDCTPAVFNVTTETLSEQGQFKVYQVVGTGANDTLWYDVDPGENGGIVIPAVEDLPLGIKFTTASPAYTFDGYVAVTETGAAPRTKVNGDTIYVAAAQKNMSLSVNANAVSYNLAFYENAGGSDEKKSFFGDSFENFLTATSFSGEDADGNWTVTADYSVNSPDKSFPMAMYRDGYCMKGFTFADGDDTDGLYSEFNDEFIDAFARLNKDPATATTLYAYWAECTDGVTVKLENTDKGAYKFTRTFDLGNSTTAERVYEASTANFKIPSVNNDVSFTNVEFVMGNTTGYILDTQNKIQVKGNAATAIWTDYTAGDKLTVNGNVDSVKAPVLKSAYRFAYDRNFADGKAVFYSPEMKFSELYTIADDTQSKSLQSFEVMARTDACLTGWALDAEGNNVIGTFDVEVLRMLATATSTDTLYAVWKAAEAGVCEPKTFKVISGMEDAKGSFQAYRVLDSDTSWYDVDANGLEIPTLEGMALGFKFTGASTYNFGTEISVNDGVNTRTVSNGDTILVAAAQNNLTLSMDGNAVKYYFAFNENTSSINSMANASVNVFFGDSWQNLITAKSFKTDATTGDWMVTTNYTVESTDKKFPMALYRDDGNCLQGYAFSANGYATYTELDDDVIAEYSRATNSYGSNNPMVLYAIWTPCALAGTVVDLAYTDKGSYTFSRTFSLGNATTPAREYVVSSADFRVPSDDISFNGVTFGVTATDVILDNAAIAVKGTGSTDTWTDYTVGDMLTAGANLGSVKAPLLKNSYKFAYDKNWGNANEVFYSPSKVDVATYTIADVSESKSLQPLDVMARTDACLTGWALDAEGNHVIGTFDVEALRTLATAANTDTLYAVWTEKGTDCSPKTFTVTSAMPTAQGSFKAYRVLGSDTAWYDVDASGLVIPTVEGLEIGVKFTAASPAYTFDSNVSVDVGGTAPLSIANGKTFEVAAAQKNVKLSVISSAVEYTLAFNENDKGVAYFGDSWSNMISSTTHSTDDDGNWIVEVGYSMNSSDKKFPMAVYRDGYCLQGYTFAADDNTDGLFTELDDDFVAKFAELGMTSPVTLYAYWGTCTASGTTLKLVDTDKGSYKFTRTFALGDGNVAERTYTATTANFKVPSNNDVSFSNVVFEVKSGVNYILDTEAKYAYRKASAWTDIDGLFTVDSDVDSIKAPVLKNTYKFTYDKNYSNGKAVFYSPSKIDAATYTIADVLQSKSLQSLDVMARTDACLTGWALDPDGDALIGEFDGEALRVINALEDAGEDVSKLYAVWTAKGVAEGSAGCTPKTFTVTSAMPTTLGSFKVYRVLGSDTTWYDVGSNGFEIPTVEGMKLGVKFTAASPAYTFGNDVSVDVGGTSPLSIANGKTFEVAAAQKNVKLSVTSDAVDYIFAFNSNDKGVAYFGDSWADYMNDNSFSADNAGNWIVKAGYSVNSADKKFPMAMYRDGYCLLGYTFAADDNTDGLFTELDDAFIAKFAELGKTSPATLYAYWETCSATGSTLKLADTDKGAFKFTRKFALGDGNVAERTYTASTANFKVPSNNDVSFSNVVFEVKNGMNYILDTEAKYAYRKASAWTEIDGLFTVDSDVDSVKAPLLKNSYRFVYDKNYSDGKAVFYSPGLIYSATYALESVSQSRSLQTFDVMARTDACLTGWSLDKAGRTVIGTFDAEALRVINALEAAGEDVSKLYAVWTAKGIAEGSAGCTPKTFTVTSGMPAAQGSFKLYRVYASETTWYDVGSNGFEIPTLAGMELGVKFTSASPAYTFGENVDGADASGTTLFTVKNGDMFTVAANQKNAKLSVTSNAVTYTFAFNANVDKSGVFSGTGFATTGNFVIGDVLPMNLYRTDAKLVGWSFEPLTSAEDGNVFTELNDEFVEMYENRANADTLYAVWTVEQTRETYDITITNMVEEGSFELKNASGVYTVRPGETLTIPAETDLTFAVSFKPNSYNKNTYSGIDVLDANSGALLTTVNTGDTYKFVSDVSLRAVGTFSPVQFALDANADMNKVFFGDAFKAFSWVVNSFEDVLPTEIYRTDAVLVGWSLDKNATKGSVIFDEKLADAYNSFVSNKNNANKTPVLYAVWQKKTMETITVKADSVAKGTLTLTQFVGDRSYTHAISDKGVKVPSVAEGLIFQAHFNVNDSWSLSADKPLVWTTAKAKDSTANDVFKVVKTDVTVKVLAVFKEFHFVFEATSKDSLFYGEDWKKDGDFASTEDNKETSFPTMVYNTDSCIAGWSVKIGTTSYTNLQDTMISDLFAAYPNINSSTDVRLYAQWTDKVEDCAGNIARVEVDQLHGDVQFIENAAMANLVHKFNKFGSMLLPAEIESDNWTVSTKPDSSFVLDSLVVLRDGKKEAVLHEGDHLPTNMENVVLKAYFGKANKTPIEIVDKNFAQSGNAVRMGFKTSDFEVTRKVSARVQIVDEKGVVVIDTLLGDSVVSAFADEVVMRVFKPGSFKMQLSFSDGRETASYSEKFTVSTQVATVLPESWQMISLAPVDTSAIIWNDSTHFYWWDDSYCGEYWQYKMFQRGDEIVGTRGIWYSSLNGSPLVWRTDVEDDGKDVVWNLDSIGSGWNLVANPHGWRLNLYVLNESARKDVDEPAEVTFWRYNAETSDYEEVETIDPYEAVWAKVSKKTQWTVSAKPIFTITNASEKDALEKRVLAKASTKNRWTLQAMLEDNDGHRDSWNILGISSKPFVAEEPPTSFGDHVTLSIVDGEHGLAKSIKDSDSEMEWTIALSATSDRVGNLTFAGIKDINALGYHVYVTVDDKTTEMKEGSPMQVSLSSKPKTATVRVERSTIVVAQKSGLKGLRSAKLGNQLHVTFEVPDELVDESTKVQLLNAKGNVVATVSATSVFGTNKVVMDLPKNGVYIVRVRVGSAQLIRQILVK